MRAIEFESSDGKNRLDEIGPLISIANWFAKKYHDTLATGAQKLGAGKIQNFTNQHFRTFMQFMGMNKVDWPTLTLYVVYRYLRLVMKLSEQDVLSVLNSVMVDPTVKGKKFTSIDKIRDPNKNTLISSLSRAGGDPKKLGQIIGEKMIAAGAMQQVQNHWDRQAGVRSDASQQAPAATSASKTASTVSPPSVASPPAPSPRVAAINAAISKLKDSNP